MGAPRTPRGMPIAERLQVLSDVDATGCWIWTGTTMSNGGYGRMTLPGGNHGKLAHRVSYETFIGPIPPGMTVDHICFQPPCVNPAHLQLLTNEENAGRQRKNLSSTCKRGHSFSPENTIRKSDGSKTCRECSRTKARAAYHRRRAAMDVVLIQNHEFYLPPTPTVTPAEPT